MKSTYVKSTAVLSLIIFTTLVDAAYPVTLNGDHLEAITIDRAGLFPEGIDYNPITDKFIVGSMRHGGVYEIGPDGSCHQIVTDDRLNSVLGIRVDHKRNKLFVANVDIGSSINTYDGGIRKLAGLGIYELSTGKPIHYIDLGQMLPDMSHLANDIALDKEGNAYITDSLAPVIYKVDTKGHASIFLKSDKFAGEGINLNGIAYHPDGFLIVVKKGVGLLFKVPLDRPDRLSEIKCDTKLIGGDGLILASNDALVVIANRASDQITETVFSLKSDDHWQSAQVINTTKFGKVYLTTGTIKKGKIYVIHSNNKTLVNAPKSEKSKLKHKGTIQQVGVIE